MCLRVAFLSFRRIIAAPTSTLSILRSISSLVGSVVVNSSLADPRFINRVYCGFSNGMKFWNKSLDLCLSTLTSISSHISCRWSLRSHLVPLLCRQPFHLRRHLIVNSVSINIFAWSNSWSGVALAALPFMLSLHFGSKVIIKFMSARTMQTSII